MRHLPLKALPILLYLALGGHVLMTERITSLGLSPALVFYAGLFGFLTVCLMLTAYVRNPVLRWSYALILAASAFYLDSYERITADHMTYDAFINMLNSAGAADEAMGQHAAPMLTSLVVTLLLFIGIGLKPRRALRLPGFVMAAAPILGLGLLSVMLFVRGGEGARGLPGAFTPLAYAAIWADEMIQDDAGPRRQVSIPRHATKPRDIVFLLDESIAGQYLDINSPTGVRSGLKAVRADVAVRNFGLGAAITNCSVGTNLSLRFGGSRTDYRRINASMPSIWRYAKGAGMRTFYIDAQRTGGRLHNMMDGYERRDIDRLIQFEGVPVRDRDMAAADTIARLLANDTADFIWVNKVGAHFPVHDKYPDAFMRYQPALPRGRFEDISDTGSREGFGGTPQDWVAYRNAYRNTLTWNVGAFFDRLLGKASLRNATIVYTGDHGQDLHERGSPGLDTHCSSDPVQEEGLVPIVVLEGRGPPGLDYDRFLAGNRNHASHYRIFPTLLELMGYDAPAVRRIYGASLADPPGDDLTFNSRFNARLGREPIWRHIDLGKIAAAPEDQARPGQP